MKRGVSLYIAGQKVDIEDKSLILFNYALTDLTNPTIVKNSYSKEISLKGTPTNNKVFGGIFRYDRQTLFSDTSDTSVGVNFDPMRKTPFEIYDEMGSILESGYVKMNSIKRNGVDISYNITLYGGLGSFLYGLSYKEDGSKKTLADLSFYDENGVVTDFTMPDCVNKGASLVSEAWDYLETGTSPASSWWHIINFAPMYNGLPKGFDTKKALVNPTNLANETDANTAGYGVKSDADGYAMVIMANDHTEAEMNDYRWYLQRPVIKFGELLKAISDGKNNGGYRVDMSSLPRFVLDDSIWMTLGLISEEDRTNDGCIKNVLNATKSPAEILLSWVKMYGLVIRCDSSQKKIEIISRDTYYLRGYEKGVVDLSNRIDKGKEINIVPTTIESSRYQFGGDVAGAAAQEYLEEYGVAYGAQVVDTSWEFNDETKVLTDSIVFKGAVDFCDKGENYKRIEKVEQSPFPKFLLPFPLNEDVSIQLWSNDSSKNFKLSAQVEKLDVVINFNEDYPGYDKFNKLQLRNEDLSEVDGSHILVFFGGMSQAAIVVTQDVAAFNALNEGRPCWLYKPINNDGKSHLAPLFGRSKVPFEDVIYMLEWQLPKRLYSVGVSVSPAFSKAMYGLAWQSYMQDRYNANTRKLSCKVNLRGLPIGADLMNRFFWYENSIWILEKITNYSLTTFDDAECEFVQVRNRENYTNGQYKLM